MKESSRNLLVGMFVITSLVVLAALMVIFGEAPSWLGGSEWTLRITGVRELRGIGEGGSVTLNGVEIGRIQHLEFEDPAQPHRGVVIVTGIKKSYSVPQGAYAKIYGATLGFGTGHVAIVCEPKGDVEPLDKENASIRGEMHSMIGELVSKDLIDNFGTTVRHFGELAAAAKPVAENLARLMEDRTVAQVDQATGPEVTANLSTLFERFDTALANLNKVVGDAEVQTDVKTAISDFKGTVSELRQAVVIFRLQTRRVGDNLYDGIDGVESRVDRTFEKIMPALDNLDEASRRLARMLGTIEEGHGTAGRLVRDDRLYEAGVVTLERLSELIATLQRIFGKAEEDGYIKVGKATPVGTWKVNMPVGEFAARVITALDEELDARAQPGTEGQPEATRAAQSGDSVRAASPQPVSAPSGSR